MYVRAFIYLFVFEIFWAFLIKGSSKTRQKIDDKPVGFFSKKIDEKYLFAEEIEKPIASGGWDECWSWTLPFPRPCVPGRGACFFS
jgi:hypothetical protein